VCKPTLKTSNSQEVHYEANQSLHKQSLVIKASQTNFLSKLKSPQIL